MRKTTRLKHQVLALKAKRDKTGRFIRKVICARKLKDYKWNEPIPTDPPFVGSNEEKNWMDDTNGTARPSRERMCRLTQYAAAVAKHVDRLHIPKGEYPYFIKKLEEMQTFESR